MLPRTAVTRSVAMTNSNLTVLWAHGPERFRAMRPTKLVVIEVRLNVALCLFGIAAIITAILA